jgi:hypothetical protein
MRKTPATTTATTILIALCLAATWAAATAATSYDFRHTTWGMTADEVIKSEGKDPQERSEKIAVYSTKISGKDFLLIYQFIENKLAIAGYMLDEKHTNKTDYLADYNEIKELLIKKYGEPAEDQQEWKNDLYKNNTAKWGTAISVGHLSYTSIWETPNTTINLALHGDNFEIQCGVLYNSKEHQALVQGAHEQESLNQL